MTNEHCKKTKCRFFMMFLKGKNVNPLFQTIMDTFPTPCQLGSVNSSIASPLT